MLPEAPRRGAQLGRNLPREFAPLTTGLMLWGLALLFKREPSLGWLFLLGLARKLAFALTYQIGDYYVFYTSSYVRMAILAGYGSASILAWLARRRSAAARIAQLCVVPLLLIFGLLPRLEPYWPDVRAGAVPALGGAGYPFDSQTEASYRAIGCVIEPD